MGFRDCVCFSRPGHPESLRVLLGSEVTDGQRPTIPWSCPASRAGAAGYQRIGHDGLIGAGRQGRSGLQTGTIQHGRCAHRRHARSGSVRRQAGARCAGSGPAWRGRDRRYLHSRSSAANGRDVGCRRPEFRPRHHRRLQGLLALLAAPWSAGTSGTRSRIEALLVLQGDDAHTLGPHVAASQMRRLGVGVRILFNQDAKIVLRMLQEDCFDLILFSTSRTEALAPIAQMVKRMRAESSRVPPVVLGGLVQDLAEKVQERTGVDLVTTDVRAALRLCEREKQKTRSLAG